MSPPTRVPEVFSRTAVNPVVLTVPKMRGMDTVVPPLNVKVTSGATLNWRANVTLTPVEALLTEAVPRSKMSGTSTVTRNPSM